MSGRRQAQQGTSPFNAGDCVLFSLTFNVDTGDFNEFIERVTLELCNRIQRRWCFGSATVLPCPRARQTWFVIVLESRDREMHYSVPFFIEAETIYLRGYQNQVGARFEFEPDRSRDNDMPQSPCLVRSTFLRFGCNYIPLVRATQQQVRAGQQGDPGLTLNTEEDERRERRREQQQPQQQPLRPRRPNFGQERLRAAVRELAQAANAAGSHHRTAQNLLLVIIRFCESIRNRSVRREMVDLWTVHNRSSATQSSFPQPSRALSDVAILQIRNWSGISSALMNHIHGQRGPSGSGPLAPTIWRSDSARTMGVANAAEAQRIIVLVLFDGDPNQRHGTPEWGDAAPDNNQRRGPGAGRAGPSWFADAAEVTPPPVLRDSYMVGEEPVMEILGAEVTPPPVLLDWYMVGEEPVMEILGVFILQQSGGSRVEGIYGSITVNDSFGAQTIYRRGRDDYQRNSGDSDVRLELASLTRAISAYGCFDIDIDLKDASTGARLSKGHVSWNIYNFRTNRYNYLLYKTIGQARLEYVVYRKAVQVAVTVTVEDGDAFAQGSVYTTTTSNFKDNVFEPSLLPPVWRPMSPTVRPDGGPHIVLYWQDVVAVPLAPEVFRLLVTVSLQPKGSRRPVVKATFEMKPTESGGSVAETKKLQQGATVKVSFAWSLLPMGLQASRGGGGAGTSRRDDEL